jgi:hypothetical protein
VLNISGVKILGSHITTGLGEPHNSTKEAVLLVQLEDLRRMEADILMRLEKVKQSRE